MRFNSLPSDMGADVELVNKPNPAPSVSSMSSSALFLLRALSAASVLRNIGSSSSSSSQVTDSRRGGEGCGDVGKELGKAWGGDEENMKGGLDDRMGEDRHGGEDGGSGGDSARKSSTG